MLKRVFDILFSLIAGILFSPVIAGVAATVCIDGGGTILFHQERIGLNGKRFRLFKFRTMVDRRDGEEYVLLDEERLTKLGRRLRRWSLDELPELYNVLKGDMSLVGPRPLLPQYLGRYTPEQARRHEVKPGITGWAQVNGRNAISWEEKFALDVWYVDHRSLLLDLRILALTAWKVGKGEGVSAPGEATMPEFKGSQPAEPIN